MLTESYQSGRAVVLFGLLPHEQKMSVVHFLVKRLHNDNDEPIRSKERLTFHVGYRRFTACPIYSQHTNMNKHKVSVNKHEVSCTVVCFMIAVFISLNIVSIHDVTVC